MVYRFVAGSHLWISVALAGACTGELPADTEASTSSSSGDTGVPGTVGPTSAPTTTPTATDPTVDPPTTTSPITFPTTDSLDTEFTSTVSATEPGTDTVFTTTATVTTTTVDPSDTDTEADTDTTTGVVQMFTPLALEVADFDADGHADILVLGVDNIEGTVGRLSRGVGDGSFHPPQDPGLSGQSAFPVIGELDDTPGVDVMIAQGDGDVGVFRWAGDAFEPWKTFTNANAPRTHAVLDADADGDQDILWLWWTKDALEFGASLRPNGGGFFFAPVDTKIGVIADVGLAPGSLIAGDFNGDGDSDILVFEAAKKKGFLRLFGSPPGLFGGPKFVAGEVTPWVAAAGDFDEDGDLDIIAVEREPARLVLVRGDGLGGFKFVGGSSIAAPFKPFTLTVADLNGDDHLDIAVVDDASPELRVWSGKGDGTFTGPAATVLPAPAVRVHAARLDADAKADLVLATFAAGDVTILLSP